MAALLLVACAGVERPLDKRPDTAAVPAPTSAMPPRIIGLLALPGVFGTQPCDTAATTPVSLHTQAAESAAIGTIDVATPVRLDPAGGCTPAEVVVRRGAARTPLPTLEVAYESAAAIVVERGAADWYRVRLDDTASAWVRQPDARAFHPLTALLIDALTFTTSAWDGRLAPAPAGVLAPAPTGSPSGADVTVRVVDVRDIGGRSWGHVEVLSGSPCESREAPRVVRDGWVPLHDARGEPTVWFASRGC